MFSTAMHATPLAPLARRRLTKRVCRHDGRLSMKTSVVVVILCLMATPVAAQWLRLQTPGIPRTPDGKPNLAASAPRTADGRPDLSGLWDKNDAGVLADNIRRGLKPDEIQAWARTLVEERWEDLGKGHM